MEGAQKSSSQYRTAHSKRFGLLTQSGYSDAVLVRKRAEHAHTLQNQRQSNAASAQFVPAMRFFDFGGGGFIPSLRTAKSHRESEASALSPAWPGCSKACVSPAHCVMAV
eukprot:257509-Rhodomonas_salina.2